MTGITEETIQNYVTDARIAITNNRREKVQGKLYNSPLGVTVLANNDIDTGLLYNRQNIIDHESVKQGISFNDLCKLTEKTNE
ncbi:MAG: hypothetical protein J6Y47_00965 [Bacteroidales bacterium]|nr:hypothetical protein [Bacteroidales bacterium]